MGSIGDTLSETRRQQNKSFKEVERATRIRTRYIQALENEDFSSLPGSTYARAFIREYASFLGIDAGPLITAFNEKHNPTRMEQQIGPTVVMPISRRSRRAMAQPKRSPLLLVLIGAALLIGLFFGFRFFFGDATEQRTQVVAVDERAGAVPAPATKVTKTASVEATTGVTVKVEILDPGCWVRVVADGQLLFEGVLEASAKRTWSAKDKLVIRAGDAALVKIAVNGGKAQVFGEKGMVLEETYDRKSK